MKYSKKNKLKKHLLIPIVVALSVNLLGFAPAENELDSALEVTEESLTNQEGYEENEVSGGDVKSGDDSNSEEAATEAEKPVDDVYDADSVNNTDDVNSADSAENSTPSEDSATEETTENEEDPESVEIPETMDDPISEEIPVTNDGLPYALQYDSLEELLSTDLPLGAKIMTKGYNTPGDGGNAAYYIVDKKNLVSGTFLAPQLDNGYYAQMVFKDNNINVAQVGIFPNEAIGEKLNKLIAEAEKARVGSITFADGTYIIDKTISLRSLNYKGTGNTTLSVSKSFASNGSWVMATYPDNNHPAFSLSFSDIDFLMETSADHTLYGKEVSILSLGEANGCKITNCNFKSCLAEENGAFIATDLLWFRHSTHTANVEVSNCTFSNLTGMNYSGNPDDHLVGGCLWITGKGEPLDGTIENIDVHDCVFESTVSDEIVAVWRGKFNNVNIHDCTIKNHSHDSDNFFSFFLGEFKDCILKDITVDVGAGCRHGFKVMAIAAPSEVTFDGLHFNLHTGTDDAVNKNICLFFGSKYKGVDVESPAKINIKNCTTKVTDNTVFRTFAHFSSTSLKTFDISNCDINMPCTSGPIYDSDGDRNVIKLSSSKINTQNGLGIIKNGKLCKYIIDGNTIQNKPGINILESAAIFYGFMNNTISYGEDAAILEGNKLKNKDYIYLYNKDNKMTSGKTLTEFKSNNKLAAEDVVIHTDNPDGSEIDEEIKNLNPEALGSGAGEGASADKESQKTVAESFSKTIGNVTYEIGTDGNATVTAIGKCKKVSINKVTIDGVEYPVTAIAANACKDNKTIKKLTIGKNVTSIGKNAFKGCPNLTKVTIKANKSLKISKGAFKKLPAGATIKVKGVKGKTKKKIVKAVKKRTNATVK